MKHEVVVWLLIADQRSFHANQWEYRACGADSQFKGWERAAARNLLAHSYQAGRHPPA
jgi:hypothetical protein